MALIFLDIAADIQAQMHNWQGLLFIFFIGAVAGFLAEFLVGSKGFPMIVTVIVGIIGAWLGNLLFGKYLQLTHNALIDQIISATAGAIILVVILNILFRNRRTNKNKWRA